MSMRHLLLTTAMVIAAFGLGGCENDDELTDGGTLILDDDRGTGDVPTSPVTVYIKLGSEVATTIQLGVGESKTVTLADGIYTITFDDDTTSSPSAGDTVESSVQILDGKTTTVEYGGKGSSNVIGPIPQANG